MTRHQAVGRDGDVGKRSWASCSTMDTVLKEACFVLWETGTQLSVGRYVDNQSYIFKEVGV